MKGGSSDVAPAMRAEPGIVAGPCVFNVRIAELVGRGHANLHFSPGRCGSSSTIAASSRQRPRAGGHSAAGSASRTHGPARSGVGRALELDDVALRIAQVDRRALALGAVARFDRAGRDAQRREVRTDRGLVEGLDAKAHVVDVAPLLAGRGAAGAAQLAVD